jgi:hypothetical protein
MFPCESLLGVADRTHPHKHKWALRRGRWVEHHKLTAKMEAAERQQSRPPWRRTGCRTTPRSSARNWGRQCRAAPVRGGGEGRERTAAGGAAGRAGGGDPRGGAVGGLRGGGAAAALPEDRTRCVEGLISGKETLQQAVAALEAKVLELNAAAPVAKDEVDREHDAARRAADDVKAAQRNNTAAAEELIADTPSSCVTIIACSDAR